MNKYQRTWLRALRSDDFDQAVGAFKVINADTDDVIGYCCLGVQCEVNHDLPEWSAVSVESDYDDDDEGYIEVTKYGVFGTDDALDRLPDEDMERLGLTESDTTTLAAFNDGGMCFSDIADILEHMFLDGGIDVITAAREHFGDTIVEHIYFLGHLRDDLADGKTVDDPAI